MRRMALGLALGLGLGLGLAGCGGGPPSTGCKSDQDCPAGMRCLASTGVCVGFSTPLDASVPDLGPSDLGSGADGAPTD